MPATTEPKPASLASAPPAPDSILITGATIVDPSQSLHARRDLLIENGRVAALDTSIHTSRAASVIDAAGLIVTPGLIDLHSHLREPGAEASETIESGTRAAAAGGFTTIFCMPNTNPVCDSPAVVRSIIDRARQTGCVRVVPVAALTRGQQGERLSDLGALRDAGAGAYSDDGRPVPGAQMMRRALQYAAALGLPIFDHAEDVSLTADGVMHEGEVSLRLGLKGIPRSSEATIVARDAALALETGGRLHICHVSNRDSVAVIRHFKARGAALTAEVTPHHLTLTDAAIAAGDAYSTSTKMKPPLCAQEDRQALIAALEDGTIDCIATDHAPHNPASKDTLFDAAPFGVLGFESAFAVLYTEFVATGRWTIDFLIERLTAAPARVALAVTQQPSDSSCESPSRGLRDKYGWGTLKVGASADVALFQIGGRYLFDESSLRSRSRNSPWLGVTLGARVAGTIFEGREVFFDARIYPSGLRRARA